MLAMMRPLRVRSSSRLLACAVASAMLAACGGGATSTPVAPPTAPPPVTSPIGPGAGVSTLGYSGGTFTFSFGPGVPAGESFTVGPLAAPAPAPTCPPGFACPAAELVGPIDAIAITVGAAALPLSAITNVALSGFRLSAASFTLVDTTVDEGTTSFSSTPTGGPLVETHASPDEGAPIVTLQPNRRYVLSLLPLPSFDKPPDASFIPPDGTLATTIPETGDTIVVAFGNPIPAKEWIIFLPVAPLGLTPSPGTIDAISFETYPKQMPASVITGVVLVTPRAFSGTRLEAGLTGVRNESGLSTVLPFAIAPPGTTPKPSQLTFQTGPDYGASLTALNPAISYVLSIRTY